MPKWKNHLNLEKNIKVQNFSLNKEKFKPLKFMQTSYLRLVNTVLFISNLLILLKLVILTNCLNNFFRENKSIILKFKSVTFI